jgi:hypothetical protein
MSKMKMKFAAAGVLFLGIALHARADLLLGYTPPANDATPLFAHSPSSGYSFASGFTVGQQPLEVTSMLFRLDGGANSSYQFTAYLFSNDSDHPGVTLASVQRLFPPGGLPGQGLAFYEFPLDHPLTLSSGTTYWVGIGTAGGGTPPYIAYTSHLERFAGPWLAASLTHCTSAGYPPTGSWGVNAPEITVVYELEGSVIPEPSSAALCLLGACVVGCRHRRRTLWLYPCCR